MWFRNLQIYRLPRPWGMTADQLEAQLARGPFVATTGTDAQTSGWVAPRDGDLVHATNGQWLIRLQTEKRLLPASVVNGEVRRRAEKLADEQGYAPGRKALRELRERVVEELLPKSHPVTASTFAWIDPKAGWLCIDAGSAGKADALIEHLRHCLDDFQLKPLNTQLSPQSKMAEWLASGDASAEGFTIDRDCELKAIGEEKAAVAFKRHPLGDEVHAEIKSHLAAGKLPTKLALTWDDRISFVLTEKLEIKRLAFLDLLREEAEKNAAHADDQFDADFALMTGELSRFLPCLIEALGGEVIYA